MAEFGNVTTNAEWKLDVRATVGSGSWVRVKAVRNLTPTVAPNTVDASTYDGGFWGADAVVGAKFSLALELLRRNDLASYDAGQELIRTASNPPPDTFEARWYQPELAGGEAWQGSVMATWEPSGGEAQALQAVSVTLLGQGERSAIAMPTPTVVPVITNVLEVPGRTVPSLATAGGDKIAIYGTYFTGTTGVTIDGNAVTSFTVIDNTLIHAVTPADTAGTYDLVVTNATGASNDYSVVYA